MKRVTVVLCFCTFISCQDKVICPAFQSTYILDDSTRNAYFSYVWQLDEGTRSQFLAKQGGATGSEDSLSVGTVAQPKTDYYAYAGEKVVPWRIPKRTKYGIVKEVFYPVKNYRLRTAPMENVLAPEPVSNEFVASDFTDSLAVDTATLVSTDSLTQEPVAAVTEDEEEEVRFLYGYQPDDIFNVEQYYYNKYFSDQLIDNRPKPEPQPLVADTLATDSLASDSTGAKEPFFKGLFKKKKKAAEPIEETEIESLEESTEESEGENGGG